MTKKAQVPAKAPGAQLPAFMQEYAGQTGSNIDRDDITIPRIKIGQGTSAEVKDGTVKEGDIFLNVTGEVLAKAGEVLPFVPVATGKEFILWRDRNFEGGGIMARAKRVGLGKYAWDKPNETFKNKVGGKVAVEWKTGTHCGVDDNLNAWGTEIPGDSDSGPAATAHHNYVVVLPEHNNLLAAFSLNRTSSKPAEDLNYMIESAPMPMFGRLFIATTHDQSKGNDTWKNIKFKPAGIIEDQALFEFTTAQWKNFQSAAYTVDQSNEDGASSESDAF